MDGETQISDGTPSLPPDERHSDGLTERVLRSFTNAEIAFVQKPGFFAERQTSGTIRVYKTSDNIFPAPQIVQIASALYKLGKTDVPTSTQQLRANELFLVLKHAKDGSKSAIFCGGKIASDPEGRPNNVYMEIAIPNKNLATELFEAIKADPNTTLESVMYGIFRSPNGKSYLPQALEPNLSASPRPEINPFVIPITHVVSGVINK